MGGARHEEEVGGEEGKQKETWRERQRDRPTEDRLK